MYFPNRALKISISVLPLSNSTSWLRATGSVYYVSDWMFIWKEKKHDFISTTFNILQNS